MIIKASEGREGGRAGRLTDVRAGGRANGRADWRPSGRARGWGVGRVSGRASGLASGRSGPTFEVKEVGNHNSGNTTHHAVLPINGSGDDATNHDEEMAIHDEEMAILAHVIELSRTEAYDSWRRCWICGIRISPGSERGLPKYQDCPHVCCQALACLLELHPRWLDKKQELLELERNFP